MTTEKTRTSNNKDILYGLTPLRRTNPKPGESEWYYLDPRGAERFMDMRPIDVPSEYSPNPYRKEIQDYVYKYHRDDYEPLYGNQLPPMLADRYSSQRIPGSNGNYCEMRFDGQNLSLYKNNNLVDRLGAQSGQDDYQSARYQNLPDLGPLPEGTYYANQNNRQSLNWKNIYLKTAEKLGVDTEEKCTWSGWPLSWGLRKIWLKPDPDTDTYGRSGFTIHGGLYKGSRGCIDIPWQTGTLSDYLDECQFSVPVKVKYPSNW